MSFKRNAASALPPSFAVTFAVKAQRVAGENPFSSAQRGIAHSPYEKPQAEWTSLISDEPYEQ